MGFCTRLRSTDASGNIGSVVTFVVLSTLKLPTDQAAFFTGLPHAKIGLPALALMAFETANVALPIKPSDSPELNEAKESPKDAQAGKVSGMVIVLTSATGFLGTEIVRKLIASDQITRVRFLAVRKASKRCLTPSPKIAVHNGDPVAPRLGPLATEARAVFNEADVIIHAGADVSFLKAYNSLRATNIGSTREPPPSRDGEEDSEFVDGYTTAKWVNEVSLKRVARELALDVVVHRPTSIVPEDDVETAESKYLLGNLMFYMCQTLCARFTQHAGSDGLSTDSFMLIMADSDENWLSSRIRVQSNEQTLVKDNGRRGSTKAGSYAPTRTDKNFHLLSIFILKRHDGKGNEVAGRRTAREGNSNELMNAVSKG
ncbi:hypothetical protein CHU98_g11842 [Xylaria longipes]|nr:hypothetical protein CHU98_g11842 [Xylaria longipes]